MLHGHVLVDACALQQLALVGHIALLSRLSTCAAPHNTYLTTQHIPYHTDTTTTASKARDALGIPAHEPVNYVELYDALSCIKFHGKPMHPGVTDDLIENINRQVCSRVATGGARHCCVCGHH